MNTTQLDQACSQYLHFRELFHCGETWQQTRCDNTPQQPASWEAYATLAQGLLDPLWEQFGRPELTFGFCGARLRQLILANTSPRIAPKLDQHAAHELTRQGQLVCPRGGAAIDFYYPGQNSHRIAQWLAQHLPFDRLYLYGPQRPLHLSFSSSPAGQLILLTEHQGRRIPRRLTRSQLDAMASQEPLC
ncbi:hypothetical protein [Pseudaeromonas paramecii]|uniref:Peptidase M15A C-terminal domain-containing protein n=1 Tax=Pseudaeromonas paramecii TaxID=2138166 RepID=A0ABP8PWP1_9GAMM